MAEKCRIAAAVVVYNVFCGDSPTCQALARIAERDGITVLIYDNSTRPLGNDAYCAEQGWVYLGGQGNMGISKAYNRCVEYLLRETQTDILCLFDDDTQVDAQYFACLREAVTRDAKIFVPLLYAGGELLSPCMIDPGHRFRRFSGEEEALRYTGDQLSAINSCMALDLSLFSDYRYDENIFLDGVDHSFIADMRARGEKIRVFPYRCNHGFSGMEKPSREAALNRFRIFAKDYAYILRDNRRAYRRLVGRRALRLTVQYRTLAFLRCV